MFYNLTILAALGVIYLLTGNCNVSFLDKTQLFKCFSHFMFLDSAVNMQMTSQEQKHSLNVNKPSKHSSKTTRKPCTRSTKATVLRKEFENDID